VTAVCTALVLLALAAFVVSLMSGSVEMSLAELWRGLRSTDALSHTLVFELRLPRTLTAFAAGGVLHWRGVDAGLAPQSACRSLHHGRFRRCRVAALSAMLLGLSGLLIDVSATLGALGTTLWFLRSPAAKAAGPRRALLTGVVVAAGASAM
jgi:iron complex transport system permease protein